MAVIPNKPTFKDIQAILDAILGNSSFEGGPPIPNPLLVPKPHGIFWRQTGNYANDYTLFTTGNVPKVPGNMRIMNTTKGQELTSNFYVVLTTGIPGIGQMPDLGPFISDAGFTVNVNGTNMSGADIQDTLKFWLLNGFPQ